MNAPRKPIGFAPPPIDEDSIKAVERVLRSGWITSGPELAQFELDLSAYLETEQTLCFSSWTTACELALRWFGVGPGDDVLLPAMTYAATANIVLHCGARPVLVDVDPIERVVTLETLKAAWTPMTKVVMPVDLAGWPVDYEGISSWLKSEGISSAFRPNTPIQKQLGRPLFLADAAHSLGATFAGKPIGNQADITGFSFHAVKNLTTAEGGALTFALPKEFELNDIAQWFRTMSLHGQSKSAFEKTKAGQWNYDVVDAGFKCNMTDIQAALGRAQLKKYPDQLRQREKLADEYHQAFSSYPWYIAPPLRDAKRISSFHLFTMRIKGFNRTLRDDLIAHLKENGIASNVHFMPLPLLSLHRNRGENIADYPNSARAFEELISLPLHLNLNLEDVHYIRDVSADFIGNALKNG
jgi:dTDP-4-amino-4,6-dideoxygalactose transaminase